MSSNALVSVGKDPETGRFLNGNRLARGRPVGSKPRLGEDVIKHFAKHFAKHGARAIERVYIDDPATYLKLAVHLTPKEIIAQVHVSHNVELRAEIEVFSAGFDRLREIVGADVDANGLLRSKNGLVGSDTSRGGRPSD